MEEVEPNPTMVQRNISILETYQTNLISMPQESYFTSYSIAAIRIFKNFNGRTIEKNKYNR